MIVPYLTYCFLPPFFFGTAGTLYMKAVLLKDLVQVVAHDAFGFAGDVDLSNVIRQKASITVFIFQPAPVELVSHPSVH